MLSLIEGVDWADRFPAGWLMSAVPSTRLWKSCRGRYGLASEHRRAGITCLWWHCQYCPLTTNNLCCLVSSERCLADALGRLFCTGANPNAGLPGRSEVLEVEGCVWWKEGGHRRREKRDGERLSKQLLIPSSVASSPSLLLFHPCCQKPERDQRRPTWKASLRFYFSGTLSPCSLRYRYGNAESQIQPVPRLQRMPSLIRLSLFSFCFLSSPPPRLTPSSSSLSILCSCHSPAALRLPGR